MSERTAGEELFEAYLAQHGYPKPDHHPDLDIAKRPDYLVQRRGLACVCEVKEFSPENHASLFAGRSGGTLSMTQVLRPVREKVRAAARQLKPLADCALPLVVVLTNPHGALVHLGDHEIVWAMYGDPVLRFEVDPDSGAAVGEGHSTTGRDGKLRNDHPYISAIVVIRERTYAADFFDRQRGRSTAVTSEEKVAEIMELHGRGEVPEGSYLRADCFRTTSAVATPLPDELFNGPNDRLLEADLEREAYVQVRGRQFAA